MWIVRAVLHKISFRKIGVRLDVALQNRKLETQVGANGLVLVWASRPENKAKQWCDFNQRSASLIPRKNWCFTLNLKTKKPQNQFPSSKRINQEKFLFYGGSVVHFFVVVLFRPSTTWTWPTHIWNGNLVQTLKNLTAMWETWVWSLGQEDPLEKGVVIHSSILAWRIPWTGAW